MGHKDLLVSFIGVTPVLFTVIERGIAPTATLFPPTGSLTWMQITYWMAVWGRSRSDVFVAGYEGVPIG